VLTLRTKRYLLRAAKANSIERRKQGRSLCVLLALFC
jgi:hypothetical protein